MGVESNGARPPGPILPKDTTQWAKTAEQLQKREAAHAKGVEVFEASGAQVGDYVIVERFYEGQKGTIEGHLRVRKEFGTGRYLEIFVDGERVRFRSLYAIEIAV